ncbi:MAG: hypothetical protein LIP23_02950, partial [Planctomycetes bacterium]|nr:hypothetical protein [Planctomycetota bacterium]
MIRAVADWLAGAGVFQPGRRNFPGSAGFRFTPLAPEAYEVYNAAEVLATDNRDLIANYLTRLANLTPLNFIFYDPTGLGPLSIIERREFITTADELLEEAEIEVRASELVYNFVDESTIDIDTEWEVAEDFHQKVLAALNHGSGPDDPRVALLHRLGSRISTYA